MGKKRLRPWLEDKINEGTFPGLKYIDRHKRIFSFPWKDQKKKGAGMSGDDQAAQIIKAWAKHSGMHTEGGRENLPLWKARIRTSLTKLTDIKEVKELHNLSDQTNPYRAYKFVCPSESRSFVSSSDNSSAASPQQECFDWQIDVSELINAEGNNDKSHPNIPTVVYEKSKFHSLKNKQMGVDPSSPEISCSDAVFDTSRNSLDMPSVHHQQSDLLRDLADFMNRSTDTSHMSSFRHQQSDFINLSSTASEMSSSHHQQSGFFNLSSTASEMSSSHHQQSGFVNLSSTASAMSSSHHQQSSYVNLSSTASEMSSSHHQQSGFVSLSSTATEMSYSHPQQSDVVGLNRSTDISDIPSLYHQQSYIINMNKSSASDMCSLYPNFSGLNRSPTTGNMSSLHQHQPSILSHLANVNGHSQTTFDSTKMENNITVIPPSPTVDPPSELCSPSKPVLKIKGYFMEKCIVEDFIDERGARLFCGDVLQHNKIQKMAGTQTLYGPIDLKQIQIPDFDRLNEFQFVDENKQKKSRELQDGMERGLILRATESNISAERLCRNSVFLTTQDGKTQRLNRKLSCPLRVFDIGLFRDHLHSHITENGPQPSPSIKFFFGQEYKKNKKTFFYVKVTHIEAERLLMMAMNKSDDVDEICFSSTTPTDDLADFLKGMLSL